MAARDLHGEGHESAGHARSRSRRPRRPRACRQAAARERAAAIVAPVVKKAQDSKERADWEAALAAAQTVDASGAVAARRSSTSGSSSFQVGLDALQNAQKLAREGKDAKESKAQSVRRGQGRRGHVGERDDRDDERRRRRPTTGKARRRSWPRFSSTVKNIPQDEEERTARAPG